MLSNIFKFLLINFFGKLENSFFKYSNILNISNNFIFRNIFSKYHGQKVWPNNISRNNETFIRVNFFKFMYIFIYLFLFI